MKKGYVILSVLIFVALLLPSTLLALRANFPRPFSSSVKGSGAPASLVYAVAKAESDFRADAVSRAGAVGLMQLLPSTAEYICKREGVEFKEDGLTDPEYNLTLGSLYLCYLLEKFPVTDTAIAAYNAGEGTVSAWLSDPNYSSDGCTLTNIPYPETSAYLKKVGKFRKIYEILYR